jgi:regulatory protein
VPLATTAIRMLARREYGRAELAARLVAKGAAQADVEATLDDLQRKGYLSDARFAQALVHHKAGRYGRRAIAHELKQRQVDPEAARAALAAVAEVDEAAEALVLWQRRFGVAAKDDKERARQIRFLMARGYATSVAVKIVRTAATASTDDDTR